MAGRSCVEANLATQLTERNHELDHLFAPVTLKLKEKRKSDNNKDTPLDDDGYDKLSPFGFYLLPNDTNSRVFV